MPRRAELGYCKLPPRGGTVRGYRHFQAKGYPHNATDRRRDPQDQTDRQALQGCRRKRTVSAGLPHWRETLANEIPVRREREATLIWRIPRRSPNSRTRKARDEARKLLADGVDPSEHRKAVKATKMERAARFAAAAW